MQYDGLRVGSDGHLRTVLALRSHPDRLRGRRGDRQAATEAHKARGGRALRKKQTLMVYHTLIPLTICLCTRGGTPGRAGRGGGAGGGGQEWGAQGRAPARVGWPRPRERSVPRREQHERRERPRPRPRARPHTRGRAPPTRRRRRCSRRRPSLLRRTARSGGRAEMGRRRTVRALAAPRARVLSVARQADDRAPSAQSITHSRLRQC